MEEKERYYYDRLGEDIYDSEIDDYPSNETICDTLNQQDKRIKDLEETNKVLCNELTKNNIIKPNRLETCCGVPIYEVPKLKEENQQLKQQLKSQPAEIVDEIKKQMDARKLEYISHLTNTHCYGLRINRIFEILDDILKEYQMDKN